MVEDITRSGDIWFDSVYFAILRASNFFPWSARAIMLIAEHNTPLIGSYIKTKQFLIASSSIFPKLDLAMLING